MNQDDILCALTGTAPAEEELVTDIGDGFGTSPPGWVEVIIRRRVPNPAWIDIQRTKQVMIHNNMQQLPEDMPQEAMQATYAIIKTQVDAAMAALELKTDEYVVEERLAMVSDPLGHEMVRKELNDLLAQLDLKPFVRPVLEVQPAPTPQPAPPPPSEE